MQLTSVSRLVKTNIGKIPSCVLISGTEYRIDDCILLSVASCRDLGIMAARQGLVVLIASAVVLLKHETSTIRQRHNFISIDFNFGVGNYVKKVTNPDKVGSGPMSGRDATWGQRIRLL